MLRELQIMSNTEFETEMQKAQPLETPFRERGMQTMYRDSEAQTEPYSPEYTIRAGHNPPVLLLANLTYGKGLPAGQKEVELIERAQARQIEEEKMKTMSPVQRRRVRERLEQEEWECRSREIEA